MIRPWFAVPKAATACARSPLERAAVLDLYERADTTGYAVTLWTEGDLALDWGMDRRHVVRLLESLAAAGCIELTRAEPRSRQSSTLRVIPALHQTWSQSGSQSRSQYDEPDSPTIDESAPDVAPESVPESEPPRAESFPRALVETRPDQTRPDELQRLLQLQAEIGIEPNDADQCAVAAELVAGRTYDQLEAIWLEGRRPERKIRVPRWSVLLAGQFADLRRAALRKHAERRAMQGDYGPEPPPPPPAAPETRGWWSSSGPAPSPPAAAPAPEPPQPPRPRAVSQFAERPFEQPPPDEEKQRRSREALERARTARSGRDPPGTPDGK